MSNNGWRKKALELHSKGMSWRAIAREIGKSKSTVSDFLRKKTKGYVRPSEKRGAEEGNGIKMLFLDIETSQMILGGFGLYNQNFSLEQIEKDWTIISFSYKWAGEDETHYLDITEVTELELLEKLRSLLSSAHFLVGHNIRRFDIKKIKARMVIHGMKPFPEPRVIDTLEIAKSTFGFTSNKLAYLTQTLCKKYVKSSHDKFHGYLLWKEFLKGNPEAVSEMREYNKLDVDSLEELYNILAPWSKNLPNFDLYTEEVLDKSDWDMVGYHYTNLGKYEKWQHKKTGQVKRGRTNLLSKEKRASLLSNIV